MNTQMFVDTVLSTFFKQTKFESFTRKLRRWGFSTKRIHTPNGVSWVFEHPDFNKAAGFATCNRITTSDSKETIDLHRTNLNSTYSIPLLADGRHSTTQRYFQLCTRPRRGQYSQSTSQIVERQGVTSATGDNATAHCIGHESDPCQRSASAEPTYSGGPSNQIRNPTTRGRSASAEPTYGGGPSNQVRNPTTRGRITMPSPTNDGLSLRDLIASHAARRQRRQVVLELLSSFASQGQDCTEDDITRLVVQGLLNGRQSHLNDSLQH